MGSVRISILHYIGIKLRSKYLDVSPCTLIWLMRLYSWVVVFERWLFSVFLSIVKRVSDRSFWRKFSVHDFYVVTGGTMRHSELSNETRALLRHCLAIVLVYIGGLVRWSWLDEQVLRRRWVHLSSHTGVGHGGGWHCRGCWHTAEIRPLPVSTDP